MQECSYPICSVLQRVGINFVDVTLDIELGSCKHRSASTRTEVKHSAILWTVLVDDLQPFRHMVFHDPQDSTLFILEFPVHWNIGAPEPTAVVSWPFAALGQRAVDTCRQIKVFFVEDADHEEVVCGCFGELRRSDTFAVTFPPHTSVVVINNN
jgi:hypothetical protein